jgi:transposase
MKTQMHLDAAADNKSAATNDPVAVTTKSTRLTTKPPARRKKGRPTVRTPERAKILCDAVAAGLPFIQACAVAKICAETFCKWRDQDANFRQAIETAVALGVARRLKKIEDASDAGDWRASAWLLEHVHPQYFSRNRIEVTGADGAPLSVTVAVCLPQKDDEPAIEVHAIPENIPVNGGKDEN